MTILEQWKTKVLPESEADVFLKAVRAIGAESKLYLHLCKQTLTKVKSEIGKNHFELNLYNFGA